MRTHIYYFVGNVNIVSSYFLITYLLIRVKELIIETNWCNNFRNIRKLL